MDQADLLLAIETRGSRCGSPVCPSESQNKVIARRRAPSSRSAFMIRSTEGNRSRRPAMMSNAMRSVGPRSSGDAVPRYGLGGDFAGLLLTIVAPWVPVLWPALATSGEYDSRAPGEASSLHGATARPAVQPKRSVSAKSPHTLPARTSRPRSGALIVASHAHPDLARADNLHVADHGRTLATRRPRRRSLREIGRSEAMSATTPDIAIHGVRDRRIDGSDDGRRFGTRHALRCRPAPSASACRHRVNADPYQSPARLEGSAPPWVFHVVVPKVRSARSMDR